MTDFVLLTGMMCDERLFTSLVPELSPPSTIHTPDLTGHDDWDNLADDVLSTMPDQAILLGVSFGGALALEICARAPDRVGGLVFVDANPHADTAERRAGRLQLLDDLQRIGLYRLMWEKFFPKYLAQSTPALRSRDAILQLCWDMAEACGTRVFDIQTKALLSRRSRLDELGDFKAPTLILRGAEDHICPADYHLALDAKLSQAVYREIPGSGHLPVLENPEYVTKELKTWMTQNGIVP